MKRSTDIEHIQIEGLDIELSRKSGIKNIYLRVRPPDGVICVSAPHGISHELITEFVSRNLESIIEARENIIYQSKSLECSCNSGDKVYLWGKAYTLEVRDSVSCSMKIKIDGGNVILFAPEGSSHERREYALNELYRAEIKRALPEVIMRCSERVGVQVNSFSVRNMKTCWGTCHIRKKRIIVNLQLARKPQECLEYVVIHELVHLIEKNHTPRFHALVTKYFPDERRVKSLLADSPYEI